MHLHPSKSSATTIVWLAFLTLSACGPSVAVKDATAEQCANGGQVITVDGTDHVLCQGTPGTTGAEGKSATTTAEPAGANCPNGGVKVQVGDGAATYVCNGAKGETGETGTNGTDGTDGTDGTNGQSVTVTPEAAGANCADGGVKVQVGTAAATYVCNGAKGAAGSDGKSITVTQEAAGTNCTYGGVKLQVGTDPATYVCNGAPGTAGAAGESATVTTEAAGDNCAFGGVKVQVGAGTPAYVCAGAPGQDGHSPVSSIEPVATDVCPEGGIKVTVDGTATTLCYANKVYAENLPLGAVVFDDTWTVSDAVVQWRVVHQDATAGTLTLQATAKVADMGLQTADWNNRWQDCTMRTWLNTTFYGSFSVLFQSVVVTASVPWALDNPAGGTTSGVTSDLVYIASRTELGGPVLAGDGEVLGWFADPATAAARRIEKNAAPYYTRTGNSALWGPYNDLMAYVVDAAGAFVTGFWMTDPFGVVPMVKVGGQAIFVLQADGTYRLLAPQ